jgi:hypothetical protein
MLDWIWGHVYWALMGTLMCFEGACLYLIIASCPRVEDSFWFSLFTHYADLPGIISQRSKARVRGVVWVWRKNKVWMCEAVLCGMFFPFSGMWNCSWNSLLSDTWPTYCPIRNGLWNVV